MLTEQKFFFFLFIVHSFSILSIDCAWLRTIYTVSLYFIADYQDGSVQIVRKRNNNHSVRSFHEWVSFSYTLKSLVMFSGDRIISIQKGFIKIHSTGEFGEVIAIKAPSLTLLLPKFERFENKLYSYVWWKGVQTQSY